MQQYNKKKIYIYKTYQLYRNDGVNTLYEDITKPRDFLIGFKIVRGAYYNQDKKYNILMNTLQETHDNYNNAIRIFIDNFRLGDKLLCATHNNESINNAIQYIENNKLHDTIEFAQLMGMSDGQSQKLAKKYTVYKYLPYGNFQDTLPYLIRRLYENYPMMMNIFK